MLQVSITERILIKKYREDFYRSGQALEVALKTAASFNLTKAYLDAYQYDPENHAKFNNVHNALRSKGCGCAECSARHDYVKSRDIMKRFKKAYYDDNLYHYFLRAYKSAQTDKSEGSFFRSRLQYYESLVDLKRLRLVSVMEAIHEALS